MDPSGSIRMNLGEGWALMLKDGHPVLVRSTETSVHASETGTGSVREGNPGGPREIVEAGWRPLSSQAFLFRLSEFIPMGLKPASEWLGRLEEVLKLLSHVLPDPLKGLLSLPEEGNPFSMLLLEGEDPRVSSERIKEHLLNTGLNYEAKLARWAFGDSPSGSLPERPSFLHDAKGLVLFLLNELRARGGDRPDVPARIGFLSETLTEGLKQIQYVQILNLLATREEDFLTLFLPVDFQGERVTVTLRLGRERKGRGRSKGGGAREVVFLLELHALGRLWIDALFGAGSLSIRIRCERKGIADLLRPLLPELKSRLLQAGFEVKGLDCEPWKDPGPMGSRGDTGPFRPSCFPIDLMV